MPLATLKKGVAVIPDESGQAMQRMFEAAECRTQVELADLLGIRQSSISDAKKRNAVPAEWLLKILRIKGINPEWILTGVAPKFLRPASEESHANIVYVTKTQPPRECSAQDLVNELVRRALAEL